MPSSLFRETKGPKLSCTSPASTAICMSIDGKSIVSPTGGRAIDRHNPHVKDLRRSKSVSTSSQPASKTKYFIKKSKKNLEKPLVNLVSPGNSSRFLLVDNAFSDALAEPDIVPSLIPMELLSSPSLKEEKQAELAPSSSFSMLQNQVVILRVSLHCKGCEGKVRKHISKMEGVKSFTIDFAAKKVTVIGDVTPLGVLNSISKVKNAQFWPSPTQEPFAS